MSESLPIHELRDKLVETYGARGWKIELDAPLNTSGRFFLDVSDVDDKISLVIEWMIGKTFLFWNDKTEQEQQFKTIDATLEHIASLLD